MTNTDTNSAGTTPPGDAATLRYLHDFQQKCYWESAKVLTTGMAFYLAITSAVLGYVLTQKLPAHLPRLLVSAMIVISLVFFAAFSVWAHGLLTQIAMLDKITRALDVQLHRTLDMGSLFSHWRWVNKIIMVAVYSVGVVLLGGMVFVWLTSG